MDRVQPRRFSRDYAYYEIKNKILNGELRPDQNVVEDRLAKELEISKTPLREALQRLEVEELVSRQANGRLKVASITVKEVEELFLVRSYLEGIISKQATENATTENIEELSSYCEKIKRAIDEKDSDEVLYYGDKFHNLLYEISENKTAIKLLNMLNDHITRYRRLIPKINESKFEQDYEEHSLILSYIIDGDKLKAESAMQDHILSTMNIAIKSIEKYILE